MHLVIHGHFYQPPRENPWSGVVPRQPSAHPAHDWNERVTNECYRPNARSRVLGYDNMIEDIVNNFAFISFDIGPTLFRWLERNAPDVYQQILEADRLSVSMRQGHGNAIAHVYNHIILPLANYRDKRTQIVWGLRDFEWRFGRKAESIWLAETAVNLETIKLLIEFGMRYVILSPFQAKRVRALHRSTGWADASGGRVDPRKPYRFFLKDARRRRIEDKYIDVFFYDPGLATDVSFNHLLRSARSFADRIVAASGDGNGPLVSIATDGEVYGHHEPFADMCLSYLIRREAPSRGIEMTNYGLFLDQHPPEHEVDIDFGENDEGSSWSCVHGVARWERDCGCTTGGQPGWNQKWRKPLRKAFDMLRDRLIEVFLQEVSPLVGDPWALRDDYVLVLLDPSSHSRRAFLEQHQRRELTQAERSKLWRLLEAQKYAMFMYTSCGWFFADISGIETVQNMAYAARAIELAQPWAPMDLEGMLLEYLADASSNMPEMGNGADVYLRFVPAQRIGPDKVASNLLVSSVVLGREPDRSLFGFSVEAASFAEGFDPEAQGVRALAGWVRLLDGATEQHYDLSLFVYYSRLSDIRCYVVELKDLLDRSLVEARGSSRNFNGTADRDGSLEWRLGADDALHRAMAERFPGILPESAVASVESARVFGLSDMVEEKREGVIRTAYEGLLRERDSVLMALFERSRELISIFHDASVPVPDIFRAIAAHASKRLLEDGARRLLALLELDEATGSGSLRQPEAASGPAHGQAPSTEGPQRRAGRDVAVDSELQEKAGRAGDSKSALGAHIAPEERVVNGVQTAAVPAPPTMAKERAPGQEAPRASAGSGTGNKTRPPFGEVRQKVDAGDSGHSGSGMALPLGKVKETFGEEIANVLAEMEGVVAFARRNQIEVDVSYPASVMTELCRELLTQLAKKPDVGTAEKCRVLLRVADALHFPLDRRPLEDLGFVVLRKYRDRLLQIWSGRGEENRRSRAVLVGLAKALNLNAGKILEEQRQG